MQRTLGDTRMTDSVVVVTGAAPLPADAVAAIPPGSVVIACDGALDHALASGIEPMLLVGDLDSVSAAGRAWAESCATIEQHDPDTELALARAADFNPSRLVLLSGGGDRLDHTIAAIAALGHPSLTSIPSIVGRWAGHDLTVLHGPGRVTLDSPVGTTVSFLALHGVCVGVTIEGVRWPLTDAELVPGVSLGVSNEITEAPAAVSLSAGVLTIVHTDDIDSTSTEAS